MTPEREKEARAWAEDMKRVQSPTEREKALLDLIPEIDRLRAAYGKLAPVAMELREQVEALRAEKDAAVLAEREACAQEVERFGRPHTMASENADVYAEFQRVCNLAARAIRARKP